jgi:hypothetical protein
MITLHGIALIAELIAAAWLAIALAGFTKWRGAFWLACCGVSTLALIIAALVVIEAST